MTTFRTEDDVLTLLIHLGYLAYDAVTEDSADTLNAIWQGKRICRYGIYSEEAFPGNTGAGN